LRRYIVAEAVYQNSGQMKAIHLVYLGTPAVV
ncbi:hypothetical protein T12_4757, partial [Trichinella patagoniensis]